MNAQIEKEFIEACETHTDALYRYCYFKMSDRDAAKDLVQETFMKTWNYLAKGEKIENIRAFFYKTLGNLIIDEYRKKKTISLDSLPGADILGGSFDEKEEFENKIDAEKALSIINKIGDSYRDVVMMRMVQELSLKEIAEITGDSENAVAVKVHRGLKKVRQIMEKIMK